MNKTTIITIIIIIIYFIYNNRNTRSLKQLDQEVKIIVDKLNETDLDDTQTKQIKHVLNLLKDDFYKLNYLQIKNQYENIKPMDISKPHSEIQYIKNRVERNPQTYLQSEIDNFHRFIEHFEHNTINSVDEQNFFNLYSKILEVDNIELQNKIKTLYQKGDKRSKQQIAINKAKIKLNKLKTKPVKEHFKTNTKKEITNTNHKIISKINKLKNYL